MDGKNLKLVTELRHQLHRHPELSMKESWTKQHLMDFLKQNTDLEVVDKGCYFYAAYRAGEDRPSIAFRADFDALPIAEPEDLIPYASQCSGVSHKCGHDGHSAALAGLALEVSQNGADQNVFFLFQPGEETGEGAIQCTGFLEECGVDEIYAFHNYIGFPQGDVITRIGTMNCASKGMSIRMTGTPSHASEPENGINPSFAIAELIRSIPELIDPAKHEGILLCTIIQVDIGQLAFGTSASDGVLRLTIRAQFERELDELQRHLEQITAEQAKQYGLTYQFEYQDCFPETSNALECVEKLRNVCRRKGIAFVEMDEPTRASEDFGHYLKLVKGCAFGVGGGVDHAALHSTGYDFPDEIIENAVDIYRAIIDEK